jgi:hypothetical protein
MMWFSDMLNVFRPSFEAVREGWILQFVSGYRRFEVSDRIIHGDVAVKKKLDEHPRSRKSRSGLGPHKTHFRLSELRRSTPRLTLTLFRMCQVCTRSWGKNWVFKFGDPTEILIKKSKPLYPWRKF